MLDTFFIDASDIEKQIISLSFFWHLTRMRNPKNLTTTL